MGDGQPALRPVIAASWRRAELAGLDPGTQLSTACLDTVDPDSRLMWAAVPILDEIGAALEGTDFVTVLADRDSRLLGLRSGTPSTRTRLERLGLVAGRHLHEDAIGTNSLATAAEVGAGVLVQGAEHFIDELKQFSCYGHPIFHPTTHRLEGVLDITCTTADSGALLVPFVVSAVRRIEERLLAGSRWNEQQLLGAFHATVLRDRAAPVAAIGRDVFLANDAAVDLLDAADHAVLRGIAADLPLDRSWLRLTLSSGRAVRISVRRVADGALLIFRGEDEAPTAGDRLAHGHIAICGEIGTGRTRAAHDLVGAGQRVAWFDAADTVLPEYADWPARLAGALASQDVVVVEAVHLLSRPLAHLIAAIVRESTARVILTSAPADQLDSEHHGLLAQCVHRTDLVPLRSRREDIPALVLSMLAELSAPPELRWTPAALAALAGHDWPGNLTELRSVLRQVTRTRRVGDVTVHDLPERYRHALRPRSLTPIERAEYDAIVETLRATAGNKLAAAQRLGISRTTLYRAIRRYGIVPPVSTN
ncbi:sigma-54-dependent Fis family transcriptional regulator [Nocardia sp. NPDC088792]|uniref:sigma-54-dependent Fis family transcriptional regulator n=1 Tax=Nocardia sp. NPDC088792 TaxID=3364332 RepID=UPI003807F3F4